MARHIQFSPNATHPLKTKFGFAGASAEKNEAYDYIVKGKSPENPHSTFPAQHKITKKRIFFKKTLDISQE